MKLTVLSYIGAEDDIVQAFTEHTLRFADSLIAVSTVEGPTRAFLHQLEQTEAPVRVVDHRPAYHDQHEILSALVPDASDSTDWILPLDADEFVAGDIRSALSMADGTRIHALAWKTYVPTTDDDVYEPHILRRIRHRRSEETPQFTKVVIPAAIARSGVSITQGNHAIVDAAGNRQEGDILRDVFLAHFPVRSSAQMQSKIDRSWPAVARNPARLSTEATHWKTLHERFAGQEIDAETLTDIACRYAMPADAPTPALVDDPVIS